MKQTFTRWLWSGLVTLVILSTATKGLKLLFKIPRPLGADATGYAFPSGHAMFAFGIAGFLWRFERTRWALLVLACLVAISRVTGGYHYPIDVVGGGLLGFALGYVSQRYFLPLDTGRNTAHTV